MIDQKPFDQKLCDEHDEKAKQQLVSLLQDVYEIDSYDVNVHESDGTFKDGFWDLSVKKGEVTRIFEAERKTGKFWGKTISNWPFHYSTMDIPARKEKNKAYAFAVISMDDDYAFIVKRSALKAHGKRKRKDTKYRKNEKFMTIDVKHGMFYAKEDGKWRRWQ